MFCKFCVKEFDSTNVRRKFCSEPCYKQAKWTRQNAKRNIEGNLNKDFFCLECGINFIAKWYKVHLCSQECISKHNSRIQKKFLDIPSCLDSASRKLDKTIGYVRVYVPMHPEANTWGYVYEHRVIAEQILERFLVKDEVVHHKNGKRWDNRPENLEVMNKNVHAKMHGQRKEDLDI